MRHSKKHSQGVATQTHIWNIKGFHIDKFVVRDLLNLIAGGNQSLTVAQYTKWHELISYVVSVMRSQYENERVPKDYDASVYYRSCWEKMEAATTDKEMIEAIESLRASIQYE